MRPAPLFGLAFVLGAAVPATTSTSSQRVAPDTSAVPTSFFGMETVNVGDIPKLTFGTVGHPAIGAWVWIERSKGVFDFTLFDQAVDSAGRTPRRTVESQRLSTDVHAARAEHALDRVTAGE